MAQETINAKTLRVMLDQGQPVTVLDIRPADERAEWAIPGSIHVAAYHALKAGDPDALAGVDLPEDRPVVTICGAGVTSMTAADQLRARGLQALSLAGGMKAWSLAWNSAKVPTTNDATTIIQVRRTGKGCLSYLIGSEGEAAVVDAALEPDIYLELARQHGWQITHVLDTHIHADHLSRSRLLAEMTGAALYLPAQERAAYAFTAVHDSDMFQIGAARLTALHTPGHTLESACYLINNEALVTGDTLFLTAVGRPDLHADSEETTRRARHLYRSLQRLQTLPPDTLILPGHTSEPIAFDGRAVAAPLFQVQRETAVLSLSEDEFVDTLLKRIPATPPNHSRIVTLNEKGQMPDGDVTDLEAGANRCAVG